MKMFVWNARGYSRDGFVSRTSYYDHLLHLDLFCVVDTRASADVAESLRLLPLGLILVIIPVLQPPGNVVVFCFVGNLVLLILLVL